MGALAETRFDVLAEWLANIVAPRFAYAIVSEQHQQAEAELEPLDHQQLLGLAVVLASRCTLLVRKDKTPADRIATALVNAVHYRQDTTPLAFLPIGELHGVIRVLAERHAKPRTRPDDGLIDEIAIRRALAGEPVLLTRPERDLAICLMRKRGAGMNKIMDQFRMNAQQVNEILAAEPEQLELWDA